MAERSNTPRTLADKLNYLFATVRRPGAEGERTTREYTNSEVAGATNVSGSYIGYLRRGVRENPSVETVQALARFFGVRPSYLVDDQADEDRAAHTEAQLRLVEALKHPGIERLALRAAEADLSPTALDAITEMIDQVRRLEQAAGQAKGHPRGASRRPTSPEA